MYIDKSIYIYIYIDVHVQNIYIYLNMYIYIYMCIQIYIYLHIFTHIYIYTHIDVYICIVYASPPPRSHICNCVCASMKKNVFQVGKYIDRYIYVCVCTCIYIYISSIFSIKSLLSISGFTHQTVCIYVHTYMCVLW